MKPRVLWLMQYAPHYREELLRQLALRCDLTVSATPCRDYELLEPSQRAGYRYVELRGVPPLRRLGWHLLPGELGLACRGWDVICCVEDMHFPLRYLVFFLWLLRPRERRPRWIWWGHFVGRRRHRLLFALRRFLIYASDGALTYTEEMRAMLIANGCPAGKIVSMNNSHLPAAEIAPAPFPPTTEELRLLYVGRNVPNKRLERILDLAKRHDFIRARLIGPGMDALAAAAAEAGLASRIELLGPRTGTELAPDLAWCHLVINPGAAGLLVITAAQGGRPILLFEENLHGPEIDLARRTGQPILRWEDKVEVDAFLLSAREGRVPLREMGQAIADLVLREYTVENSVERFASLW
jgi:glycosyltransferase involved in cell wall biosynthesis